MADAEAEAALLARCRAGDHAAFRRLLEWQHQRVYRIAYAVVADADDAAEVTQETFIKAWHALPGFRGDAAFGTWLTRLALNTARDHLRRSHTRRARDSAYPCLRASCSTDLLTPRDSADERCHPGHSTFR